nr:hypothetical protein VCHA53O474_250012 [Vibrio chagasii]
MVEASCKPLSHLLLIECSNLGTHVLIRLSDALYDQNAWLRVHSRFDQKYLYFAL